MVTSPTSLTDHRPDAGRGLRLVDGVDADVAGEVVERAGRHQHQRQPVLDGDPGDARRPCRRRRPRRRARTSPFSIFLVSSATTSTSGRMSTMSALGHALRTSVADVVAADPAPGLTTSTSPSPSPSSARGVAALVDRPAGPSGAATSGGWRTRRRPRSPRPRRRRSASAHRCGRGCSRRPRREREHRGGGLRMLHGDGGGERGRRRRVPGRERRRRRPARHPAVDG